jgi:DNA-binding protein Fis
MTLPDERYRAIQRAGLFLQQLTNPQITPGIPRRIREEAAAVLRHYPGDWDLQQLESAAPHVLQQRMEPLHKMIMQYENEDLRTAAQEND